MNIVAQTKWLVAVAAAAAAVTAQASHAGGTGTLCVGHGGDCFPTIQAAVDAAQDGDTIRIEHGTFDGGVTIDKSLQLVGTSAAATIIAGGGPVITIGRPGAANGGLRVGISRVTITGGVNDTAGNAAGGGVSILQGPGRTDPGATVTIDSSVISGNQAVPKGTFDPSQPSPCMVPAARCAFASGGGIANAGDLTLTNSRVTDNVVGSPAVTRYAFGAGIANGPTGTLTVDGSVVSGNQAVVSPPNGCFTEGGGIEDFGTMTIERSEIKGNSSVVVSSVSNSILAGDMKQNADAGGVDLSPRGSATIDRSIISENVVFDFDSGGDAQAFNGGIDTDGVLLLTDSIVTRNSVTAQVPDDSSLVAAVNSGGLGASDGGRATVRSSLISKNSLLAVSVDGFAFAGGAGMATFSGDLTVERTAVTGNTGSAMGGDTPVVGGGIAETAFGGPPPRMTITDSVITANRLTATAGTPQGGGIYNDGLVGGGPFPLTLTRTVIEGNKPDQCVGC
jgi:hypothetical protein